MLEPVTRESEGMVMRGSAFFDYVRQIDIEIGGQRGKSPAFYYDAGSLSAVFAARYKRLRELMPDPRYVPARLTPGLGVVVISCLEYRDTDIGPYNEVAVAIPLNEPYFRANLPGRALLNAARLGQQHAFMRHLPVTTEAALRGGVDFYNLPKFIAEIDFAEDGQRSRCRLAEGKEHILTLSGKQIVAARSQRTDLFCHSWMDGQPQSAQVKFNQLHVGTSWSRDAVVLELGERHPVALELRQLLVSSKPLQYEYAPRFEAIMFGPEHLTLPLAHSALQAMEPVEQHRLSGQSRG